MHEADSEYFTEEEEMIIDVLSDINFIIQLIGQFYLLMKPKYSEDEWQLNETQAGHVAAENTSV